jgi:hypothetical protein
MNIRFRRLATRCAPRNESTSASMPVLAPSPTMKFLTRARNVCLVVVLALGLPVLLTAQGHRWTDQFHDVILSIWNGSDTQMVQGTQLSNFPTSQTFTAVPMLGAILANDGPRWSKPSAPAAGSQATASIAAEAGVRHVADKVCFSAASTTAPVLTQLSINLRDGATGAGTVIGTWTVAISAATGQNVSPYCTPQLNLSGTTNTAMTAEFSAALANLFQAVTLTGFNVQ